MPTLSTYQLLDKEIPAILMAGLMGLAFFVVLTVTILKRCCSGGNKGKVAPRVFIETIELYFPGINPRDEEIDVHGQKLSRRCFSVMTNLLIPIIVGTMFITFWNVYLVEERVGDCETNFDCFPKIGSDFIQREPVNKCSVFEFNSNVTYECYRLVFRYAEGVGAAGGILVFTAVFSKLYFSLLVTIYNNMTQSDRRCCRFLLYGMVWAAATAVFILFVAISVSVQEIRDEIFQTITYQIQFAMYALSLLVIVVSGVVVGIGIEIKNA